MYVRYERVIWNMSIGFNLIKVTDLLHYPVECNCSIWGFEGNTCTVGQWTFKHHYLINRLMGSNKFRLTSPYLLNQRLSILKLIPLWSLAVYWNQFFSVPKSSHQVASFVFHLLTKTFLSGSCWTSLPPA